MEENYTDCSYCQGQGQMGEGGFYNAGEAPEAGINCKNCNGTGMSMEQMILNYFDQYHNATFSELENYLIKNGYPASGSEDFYREKNIIIWSGVSGRFIKAIENLLKRKLITLNPVKDNIEYITYLSGSTKRIDLPLPKKNIEYKAPRWLPHWIYPA